MVQFSPVPPPRANLMVTPSAKILKRFYFLERELILQQAGWLPGTVHWETKLLLPELLWESSILTRELRQRILELRYPERRIAIEQEAPVLDYFRRFRNAPSAAAYVLALAHEIKPWLLGVYRRYLEKSDQLDDGPSQFLLRHGIADLEAQIVRLGAVAAASLQAAPELAAEARAWAFSVGAALRALPLDAMVEEEPVMPEPAVPPLAGERPFEIARKGARDPRFQVVEFAWPDRHTPGFAGEGRQLQARQAVHHVNEVWAAEMAAACLHDFGPSAPHEFVEDAARWCFDEIRHCRMGYERLRSWGFADHEIPLDAFSYDAGAELDALTRLGIIFYFEATYIHTKKDRTRIFGDMGDRLSSHDMDFDWADELIHTYYGKKWLETFLGQAALEQKLEDVKKNAREAVFRRIALVTEEDKARTAAIFDRTLAKMTVVAG